MQNDYFATLQAFPIQVDAFAVVLNSIICITTRRAQTTFPGLKVLKTKMHKPDSTTQVHLYYFNDICKLTSVLKSIKTPQATDNVTAFSKKHSRKKKKERKKFILCNTLTLLSTFEGAEISFNLQS